MKLKARNVLAFFLAVVLFSSISVAAFAAPSVGNKLDDILWDWEYYYNNNPDLQKAFGRSPSALRNHYLTYGKKEGRSPSSLFDPVFYLNHYSDLKKAFGNNCVAAYNHFVTFGVAEGRQGSASFNVAVYKSNYEDLRKAFGTGSGDNYKYLKHWREFGQKEGRNAIRYMNVPLPAPNNKTTTYYVKTNGANLTVRSGAGTSYSVLGYLANGTQIAVYSISNKWAKIVYGSGNGYVSADYITKTPPAVSSWRYPVATVSVSNNWSVYYAPKAAEGRPDHLAIDFKPKTQGVSEPVYAVADGTVVKTGTNGANGNFVIIQHSISGTTVYSFYAHLASIGCKKGSTVKVGEQIGMMGKTGSAANGVHLHYSLVNKIKDSGGYPGYGTSFSGNKTTYDGITYYNLHYVIKNGKLP